MTGLQVFVFVSPSLISDLKKQLSALRVRVTLYEISLDIALLHAIDMISPL
jgi:hypothetical protein